MSKKSNKRGSLFSLLFLALSVFVIGLLAVFFNSKTRITNPKAAGGPVYTITSLNQISSLASQLSPEQTFTVKIPAAVYNSAFVTIANQYCLRTNICAGPITSTIIGSKNLKTTFNIGPSTKRIPVIFNYYYYIRGYAPNGNPTVSALVFNCMVNSRQCTSGTTGEWHQVQAAVDGVARQLGSYYWPYILPLSISNDASHITIVFQIKTLLTPTPIPCKDSIPPAQPGAITRTGNNPYAFTWSVSGCPNNPKTYFFRRYNGATPSGTESNCPADDTTSGSCWRTNTSVSNVPIDFNNSTCMYYGTDKGCYVYVWAKDANNKVSGYSYNIIYQPK